MISINDITRIFDKKEVIINEKETLLNYHLKIKSESPFRNYEEVISLLEHIPVRDIWSLKVNFSYDVSCCLKRGNDYSLFIIEVVQNNDCFSDSEEIEIEIDITKNFEGNQLSIYNFEIVKDFLFNKNYSDFLELFCNLRKEHDFIHFICLNNDVELKTSFIFISNKDFSDNSSEFNFRDQLEKRDQICNINWKEYINLCPNDLAITNYKNIDDKTLNYLKTIKLFLSIISIADFSTLENNLLKINIYGFRMIEFEIDLSKNILVNDEFSRIFEWLYFDGNIFDKSQIVRNILTLHCRYIDILQIDKTVLDSIKSNYKLYLKENVDRYIEVTNQISIYLNQTSDSIAEMTHSFTTKFKNNLLLFLTFFFTTMIMGTISAGKIENIFNNDIAYIVYAFLILSFIYLIISILDYRQNKKRLFRKFDRNKNFYKEFLDESDIDRLYKETYNLDIEIEEMNSFVLRYSIFWFFSIITILAVVYYFNGVAY